MKTQKQATLDTILSTLEQRDITYELYDPTPVSTILTQQDKQTIRDSLFNQFRSNQIQYKASFQPKVDDDKTLKSYVSGLLNNWLRKAKELNAGNSYKPKNPGSRTGQGDEQIKELRKLLKVTPEDSKPAVQEAIDKRLAEIKPESKVEIDVEALPEHLRGLVADR